MGKTENEISTLIRIGFEKPSYFKRSVWTRVERIMTFLQNQGEVYECSGERKFTPKNGTYTEHDLERWSKMYLSSPFEDHLDELRKVSKEMGLPLNDRRVLDNYLTFKK